MSLQQVPTGINSIHPIERTARLREKRLVESPETIINVSIRRRSFALSTSLLSYFCLELLLYTEPIAINRIEEKLEPHLLQQILEIESAYVNYLKVREL